MPTRFLFNLFYPIGLLLLFLSGCSLDNEKEKVKDNLLQKSPSLYQRLGGLPALTLVTDEFIKRVAEDKRINHRFNKSDPQKLQQLLIDYLCQKADGECIYTGRTMHDTHEGMHISEGEYKALIEDLVAAMQKYQVPEELQQDLLSRLNYIKFYIIEH